MDRPSGRGLPSNSVRGRVTQAIAARTGIEARQPAAYTGGTLSGRGGSGPAARAPGPGDRRPGARSSLILVLAFAVAQAALLADTARDKSDTVDETRYVGSAASLWAHRTFRDNCEAPVLAKWGFGVGLRLLEPRLAESPAGWQDASAALLADVPPEQLERVFFAARSATIAAVVVAGLFLWAASRRFGVAAGVVAHGLWCFSPTVLAYGSLAALDAWTAAAACVVAWAAMRVLERPVAIRAVVLGAALGAAAATKTTTLLLLPVGVALCAWGVVDRRARIAPLPALLRLGAIAAAACLVTLWAIYGFSIGGVDFADPCPPSVTAAPAPSGWLPFPAWVEGLVFQIRHAEHGHLNYFLGETRETGWWAFYVAALAVKTTLAVQAMVLVRLAAAARLAARREPIGLRGDVALLGYPAALLLVLSAGNHQPNVGFLLPAFPLAMLWLARGADDVVRAFGAAGRVALFALLAAGIVESVRMHPDHLMFFNRWAGGPAGGTQWFVHREDWGQDKKRLARWQRESGVGRIYYAAYGPYPERWGIDFDPDVPCEPRPGVYALHAIEVHRPAYALRPGCVDWLTIEPPDERIGWSIYVYRVDEVRIARLGAEAASGRTPFFRSGDARP
jgi:hypothetical protein